ncbi:copper resistance protein NlpE [Paracoccus sp. (in: a-proteobacteria)]|uniref:copper resistance protein NlpE n=1 Tax=Paracoccus sp. TaxID=267 RepID=UPI0026DFF76C|nr:copper resistance protein NlpE [Paracoccus sp. (in: a-proteobacteria)]MDO5647245.1 copper resistance protein NlpE [Paracoccus sp. (in: a-proteobacteria)]
MKQTFGLALILGAFAVPALAAEPDCGDVPHEIGSTPAAIAGVIEGRAFCSYFIDASKGQRLTASLDSDVPMEAFLYAPINQPLLDGEAVVLPRDWVYELRVAMTGPIADENPGPQSFELKLSVTGEGGPAAAISAHDYKASHTAIPVVDTGGEDAPEGYIGGEDLATLELGGLYEGVIPCASCPGIEVYVNLYNDGTYTRTETYQEEKDGTFQDAGDWFMTNGVITLASDEDDREDTFLINTGDGVLQMLNADMDVAGDAYRLIRTGN